MFAKMEFFDKTPAGRIINRVSNDVYTVDDHVPYWINAVI
jgi:hypothetical protein